MSQLSRSRFDTIARRVLRNVLGEAGFEKQEKLFLRRVDGQVHGIGLQSDVDQFTFNLGFHYDFLHSWSPASDAPQRRSFEAFGVPDFLLSARLGRCESDYRNAGKDTWYAWGDSPEEAKAILEQKARFAVDILESARRRWADPATFLQFLTPTIMLSEVVVPEEVTGPVVGGRADDLLLRPFWHPNATAICEFLRIVAMRCKDQPLADEYARVRGALKERYKKRGW